jgi:predicted Kef-type K+ transport protein
MSWVGPLLYILVLLADITLVVFAFSVGRRLRLLRPLALGLNAIPVLLFSFALISTLRDMRTNADAGLGVIAGTVMVAPFLVCFIASTILVYRQLKSTAPESK